MSAIGPLVQRRLHPARKRHSGKEVAGEEGFEPSIP